MTKPTEPTLTCSDRNAVNVCPKHGETGNEPCAICYGLLVKPRETNLNFEPDPTLTCSEVVERLAKCVQEVPASQFIAEATKILHSWRERRVQELEELLAKRCGCSHCADSASGGTSANDSTEIRESK